LIDEREAHEFRRGTMTRRWGAVALTRYAHQFVGRTKQTVQLPELRPLLMALFTVQAVKAIKLVCAVPARGSASVRPTRCAIEAKGVGQGILGGIQGDRCERC